MHATWPSSTLATALDDEPWSMLEQVDARGRVVLRTRSLVAGQDLSDGGKKVRTHCGWAVNDTQNPARDRLYRT
jgi:hypothetical protein